MITIRRKAALVVLAFAAIGLVAALSVESGSEIGSAPSAQTARVHNP